MIELAIAAMAIVAIAAIAYPLVRSSLGSDVDEEGEEILPAVGSPDLTNLAAERDSLYRAIKEIDFEHALGNLSAADYQELRDNYKAKTLAILKAIHDHESAPPPAVDGVGVGQADKDALDAAVEEAVRRRRAQTKVRASRRECRDCGIEYGADDNFCPHCGRPLALCCPDCGEPYTAADQFCARCGAKVGHVGRDVLRRASVSGRR